MKSNETRSKENFMFNKQFILFPLASSVSVAQSRVLERKNVGIGTRETWVQILASPLNSLMCPLGRMK